MSATNQSSLGDYSNTNAATTRKGKTSNNRIRNHKNGSRRNNQTRNISLASFTGEVPSVEDVLVTVSE